MNQDHITNISKKGLLLIILGVALLGALLTYFISSSMTDSSPILTAQNGDMVSVHYTGKLPSGDKFDSSLDRGQPFTFKLGAGMVIKGWDEGVLGMKVGEKKVLEIPAEKGYGSQGVPDGQGGYLIPPNSTLIFDVEVMDIKRQ